MIIEGPRVGGRRERTASQTAPPTGSVISALWAAHCAQSVPSDEAPRKGQAPCATAICDCEAVDYLHIHEVIETHGYELPSTTLKWKRDEHRPATPREVREYEELMRCALCAHPYHGVRPCGECSCMTAA